ncbi:MAG TPA: SMP-30/gluconolactonase/LRE family protein [Spirochaetota bacterium]|nr:SMP-30/gluconolactonase/LRE family protein [Spirochaetota bacterium]
MYDVASPGEEKCYWRICTMKNIKAIAGFMVLAGLGVIVFVMGLQQQVPRFSLDTVVNDSSFYPEGPLWMNSALYYTEYSKHRVMRWNGKENTTLWTQRGCGPSALMEMDNGTMLVTCYDSGSLVKIDTRGRALETIDKDAGGNPFNGPNDMVKDEKGGIYFSCSGKFDVKARPEGSIYYMRPGGEIIRVADGLHYPNGLALGDNGNVLLVNEHLAKKVSRFSVAEKGLPGNYQSFLKLESVIGTAPLAGDYTGPDGLKSDDRGRVYVCVYGTGKVLIIGQKGELLDSIEVPLPYVTNITFGDTCSTLFITASEDAFNPPYPGSVFRYTTGTGEDTR